MKKAGVRDSGLKLGCGGEGLLREEQVAGPLERAGDGALVFGGEVGVFARQDLAGVGHEMAHHLGRREGNFGGREGLLGGCGGAHGDRKEG